MKLRLIAAIATCCTALVLLPATRVTANPSNVAINGYLLSREELSQLQYQLGERVPPGNYIVDDRGCWMNLLNGQSGCLGGGQSSQPYHSRYGSGERTSDGSWSHWSNYSGTGVGGTSDGCIYTTTGWSNC